MLTVETTIKAQFHDLDPMGVVWHGNYPRFLEQARCDLLDRIGYNYEQMRDSGHAWPVVDMRIKYVRPIKLFEFVVVAATLVEFENRLKIAYVIRREGDREVLTRAHTIQVAVRIDSGEMLLESPAILLDKVRGISCGGG